MPFIPHTAEDQQKMLATIGIDSIAELFSEIPKEILQAKDNSAEESRSEMEIMQTMHKLAKQDEGSICFAGGGAYDHYIPAAVWEIASRGEFYSAYTPYQAEASQGTLQVIYEYQSMLCELTAMNVSNASLYDGATALAEAILMAVRANKKAKSKRVLVPSTLHPSYIAVAKTIVSGQQIEIVEVDCSATGTTETDNIKSAAGEGFVALVLAQPNYFGIIEQQLDQLTNWAKEQGALTIAVVNPTALALLEPPGSWGDSGADIACGEGQPLGIPLSSGGPYLGFLCCKTALMRQIPGRIVGKTTDINGKPGFTLTLQAREQHIRRSRATSNICTNQGLMAIAATLYLALMGQEGLAATATRCQQNTHKLANHLMQIKGIQQIFNAPFFHDVALSLPAPADKVIKELAKEKIIAGIDLGGNNLLVSATELRTDEEIELFASKLQTSCSSLSLE